MLNSTTLAGRKALMERTLAFYTLGTDLEVKLYTPVDNLAIFQIYANGSDYRKVLGRRAATLDALKYIFGEIGKRDGVRMDVMLKQNLMPAPAFEGHRHVPDDSVDYNADAMAEVLECLTCGATNLPHKVTYQNIPAATTFIVAPEIDDIELMESLRTLLVSFGGKANRKFYL